jgi:hypothetical protein
MGHNRGQLPQRLSAAPALPLRARRRPEKTERPHPRRRGHPINHHVTGRCQRPRAQVSLAAPLRHSPAATAGHPGQEGHTPAPHPAPAPPDRSFPRCPDDLAPGQPPQGRLRRRHAGDTRPLTRPPARKTRQLSRVRSIVAHARNQAARTQQLNPNRLQCPTDTGKPKQDWRPAATTTDVHISTRSACISN